MTRQFRAIAKLLCAACLSMDAIPAYPSGDAARGARLHQSCLGCHGTELYVPGRAKVKSLAALRKETQKWNDRYNPKFSNQEVEDLVAYLNQDFYKFR